MAVVVIVRVVRVVVVMVVVFIVGIGFGVDARQILALHYRG